MPTSGIASQKMVYPDSTEIRKNLLPAQGNRSKNSGVGSQDGMEIAWVPPSHFAAYLEALARLGGTQQVHRHMPHDGHIVRSVAVAQA